MENSGTLTPTDKDRVETLTEVFVCFPAAEGIPICDCVNVSAKLILL